MELDGITSQQWSELLAGEHEPWGPGEGLAWADKQRHVGVLASDGGLVAVAAAMTSEVEVAGASRRDRFAVVGIGGVFVTSRERGRGLVAKLFEPLLAIAEDMGPGRAMLFCRPQLTAMYRKAGFAEIAAPVWAEQPDGRIEMPLRAMWRGLRRETDWPAGRVDVLGLPF